MILPNKFLAEVLIELAEEVAYDKFVSTHLAMFAYGKYRNMEDIEGMNRCKKFMDQEDINAATEKMVDFNLEKMLSEPLKLDGDIKKRLADPIEREKLKDEVKGFYRNNFIYKYLEE